MAYTKLIRGACAKGAVVRVQTDHGNHTLWAWAKIASVSERRPAHNAIDADALREAGCPDMKKDDYIQAFCTKDGVVGEIVCVRFSHLWTRFGVRIEHAL